MKIADADERPGSIAFSKVLRPLQIVCDVLADVRRQPGAKTKLDREWTRIWI
jgi:hypothetical protein